MTGRWYGDAVLIRGLPARYRLYAAWSRIAGDPATRKVKGGSFLLRAIRGLSRLAGLSTVANVRGIDGLEVVADFGDARILEVIHEIRGENPEYAVMQALLSAGDTFVDVGANFGTFSLLASRLVGPSGQVLAIEPQPALASGIVESARLSGVSNIRVIQVAVGAASGSASLLVPANDTGRSGLFPAFSGSGPHSEVRVEMVTLDSIVSSLAPAGRLFIKIDVEGSELAVLEGAAKIVAASKPVIIVELNPWSARAAGRSTSALVQQLATLGYRTFSTTTSYPKFLPLSDIPLEGQHNLLAMM